MSQKGAKKSDDLIPAMIVYGVFGAIPTALVGMAIASFLSSRFNVPLGIWQGLLIGAMLGAGIGALRAYLEVQRRMAFERSAAYLGLEPLEGVFRGSIMGRIARLFSKEVKSITAFSVNNDAAKVVVGDVQIITQVIRDGQKRTGSESQHSYVYFEFAGTSFPRFDLYPESHLIRMVDSVQRKDIDFEDSPEFSSLYHLQSEDSKKCRALFDASIRNRFSRSKNWTVSAEQSWIVFLGKNRFSTADDQKQFLRQAMEIASLFHQRATGA